MDATSKNSSEYNTLGRTLLSGLLAPETASNMTLEIQKIVNQLGEKLLAEPRIGEKPAYELYGYRWWPMTSFQWGLTQYIETIVGKPLVPTYSFFRSYQHGDICRIHADRAACEHSMSLTLGYGNDKAWSLSVEDEALPPKKWFNSGQDADYGGNSYTNFPMNPGDAVLYKGIIHRHGRLKPNPNRWSAHMFLHWVERDGPYIKEAYDGNTLHPHSEFVFPKNTV